MYTPHPHPPPAQCTINGVSYDKLEKGSGTKVQKLEIFFFGCPYIPSGCMAFFPNLTELRIVNQKFTRVSGLEACVNLTSLWICEAQVEVGVARTFLSG